MDWNIIDKKWQKKWSETNDHETDYNDKEKKFITVAYPYPNSPPVSYTHLTQPTIYSV